MTRVTVLGAVHMAGVAQKGAGNPYDFSQITYLVPLQPLNTANCTRTVAGLEPLTISLADKSLVHRLQSLSFPLQLDLELSPDPLNVQRNICIGFSEVVVPLVSQPAANEDIKKPAMKFGS
jgi:hypothetical protein